MTDHVDEKDKNYWAERGIREAEEDLPHIRETIRQRTNGITGYAHERYKANTFRKRLRNPMEFDELTKKSKDGLCPPKDTEYMIDVKKQLISTKSRATMTQDPQEK